MLELYSGEIAVLRGRNGCGKTTLGKLLAGILKPDSGRVIISGNDTAAVSLGRIGELLGYVWQDVTLQFFSETVLDDMTLADVLTGRDRNVSVENARMWLSRFGLSEYENTLISRLSGGERARLALAGTLMRGVGYLILDEPTANLDDKNVSCLCSYLTKLRTENGVGMLVVSHDEVFSRTIGDRLITMDYGEIKDDRCL